jgi:hypothetical protein
LHRNSVANYGEDSTLRATGQQPDMDAQRGSAVTLQADLDQLRSVGGYLQGLGREVTALKFGPSMMGTDSAALKTVGAMNNIQYSVLNTTLIPSCSERLSETGDIMINVADQFKNADEGRILDVASTLTKATGTWGE